MKTSERSSSNIEHKTTFWKGYSFDSLCKSWFKFALIHVKFDANVLARPKTTFENKLALAAFRRKQLLSENANPSQNRIKKVILHIRHSTNLTLNIKTNVKERRFCGSIKKQFQCVNSSEQLQQKSGRAQKHIWKQSNISLMFPKTKDFLKIQSFSNSHQRGVLSPSNLTEHLINKMGWAQNRISKTIRSSLQQVKNPISFSNRCTFKSTAVFISELTQHLMTSLREPTYYSRKWVNVHREILKRQIHSKNFIPS